MKLLHRVKITHKIGLWIALKKLYLWFLGIVFQMPKASMNLKLKLVLLLLYNS